MSVKVKICGVTLLDDARAAAEFGADALGFNFYAGSPRFVTPEVARQICATLPAEICRVGVFVNEERGRVEEIVNDVGLTAVQFHGDETPTDCERWSCKVIKAVRVRDRAAARAARLYPVDFVLADAFVEGMFGGSGKTIAVELLDELDPRTLIVAGGLTPDNVAAVVERVRPFAVDVASGVEISPGRKDPVLMRRFIQNANAA